MSGHERLSSRRLRIAVLFSRLSGYMAACLKAVHEKYQVELLVVRIPPTSAAPFEERHFAWIDRLYDRADLSQHDLERLVENFQPDCVLMAGWFDKGYLRVARRMKRRGVVVIAGADTQWSGSIRQLLGKVASPIVLHTAIDIFWAAGERQRLTAQHLGFSGARCWSGYYTCNWRQFAARRSSNGNIASPSFLFVGRYVHVKGLDVLIEAYRRYRSNADRPWKLRCAGSGELSDSLQGEPGIEDLGFVQPDELPRLFAEAAAFVLPSTREPWGVVIHEAAAAGLPIICSDACGAGVHLVSHKHNGFVFESGNVEHLTECLHAMTSLSPDERMEMSNHSHELSKQYTPDKWASTLIEGIQCRQKEGSIR